MSNLRLVWLVLTLVGILACGGSDVPPPNPGGDVAPSGQGETAQLELAELKFYDADNKVGIVIHADGRMEVEGKHIGTIQTSGNVLDTTGKTIATLQRDGKIKSGSGTVIGTFAPDGSITESTSNGSMRIENDGKLVTSNPNAPQLRVEGATTPGTRRTALLALLLYFTVG